jgi:hypothetical protein
VLRGFSLFLFLLLAVTATVRPDEKGEFFVGTTAQTAFYSVDAAAFGGGAVFGYSFDIGAIGVTLDYLADTGGLTTYAPGLFVRFYLPLAFIDAADRFRSGPFLQFGLGPTFHTRDPRIPPDAVTGTVAAGLSAGWRVLLGRRWYIEPALRGGTPFLVGAGVTGGLRL